MEDITEEVDEYNFFSCDIILHTIHFDKKN